MKIPIELKKTTKKTEKSAIHQSDKKIEPRQLAPPSTFKNGHGPQIGIFDPMSFAKNIDPRESENMILDPQISQEFVHFPTPKPVIHHHGTYSPLRSKTPQAPRIESNLIHDPPGIGPKLPFEPEDLLSSSRPPRQNIPALTFQDTLDMMNPRLIPPPPMHDSLFQHDDHAPAVVEPILHPLTQRPLVNPRPPLKEKYPVTTLRPSPIPAHLMPNKVEVVPPPPPSPHAPLHYPVSVHPPVRVKVAQPHDNHYHHPKVHTTELPRFHYQHHPPKTYYPVHHSTTPPPPVHHHPTTPHGYYPTSTYHPEVHHSTYHPEVHHHPPEIHHPTHRPRPHSTTYHPEIHHPPPEMHHPPPRPHPNPHDHHAQPDVHHAPPRPHPHHNRPPIVEQPVPLPPMPRHPMDSHPAPSGPPPFRPGPGPGPGPTSLPLMLSPTDNPEHAIIHPADVMLDAPFTGSPFMPQFFPATPEPPPIEDPPVFEPRPTLPPPIFEARPDQQPTSRPPPPPPFDARPESQPPPPPPTSIFGDRPPPPDFRRPEPSSPPRPIPTSSPPFTVRPTSPRPPPVPIPTISTTPHPSHVKEIISHRPRLPHPAAPSLKPHLHHGPSLRPFPTLNPSGLVNSSERPSVHSSYVHQKLGPKGTLGWINFPNIFLEWLQYVNFRKLKHPKTSSLW